MDRTPPASWRMGGIAAAAHRSIQRSRARVSSSPRAWPSEIRARAERSQAAAFIAVDVGKGMEPIRAADSLAASSISPLAVPGSALRSVAAANDS